MVVRAAAGIAALALLSVGFACSSNTNPAGDGPAGAAGASHAGHGGVSGAGAGGAGGIAVGEGDGGASDYRVRIEATRSELCLGECTELTAEARDGLPPYTYTWSSAPFEGAGPHRVCPDATTTYAVTATDSGSSDDEFARPMQSARAELTIEVSAACEPTADAGEPLVPEDTLELCSLRIAHKEPTYLRTFTVMEGSTNVASDAEGNLYMTGTFDGPLTLGEETFTSRGEYDSFVVKLNAACEVVWAKHFGASEAHLALTAIAAGPSGTVAVGGGLFGAVDFGLGLVASGVEGVAVLLQLDARDGALIWNQAYSSLVTTASIWNLGVDGAGNIVMSGHAAADTTFGNSAHMGGPSNAVPFIAKVSSSGEYVFSTTLSNTDTMIPIAVHSSGAIAALGWAFEATSASVGEARIPLTGSSWRRYLVLLAPSGELSWGAQLDADIESQEAFYATWSGDLAFDPEGNLLVRHGYHTKAGDFVQWPQRLTKWTQDGEILWTIEEPGPQRITAMMQGVLDVDAAGGITRVAQVTDEATITPEAIAQERAPRNDVYVEKLTAEGERTWRHLLEGRSVSTWGLIGAADHGHWVVYGEGEWVDDAFDGTLIVEKLAP